MQLPGNTILWTVGMASLLTGSGHDVLADTSTAATHVHGVQLAEKLGVLAELPDMQTS